MFSIKYGSIILQLVAKAAIAARETGDCNNIPIFPHSRKINFEVTNDDWESHTQLIDMSIGRTQDKSCVKVLGRNVKIQMGTGVYCCFNTTLVVTFCGPAEKFYWQPKNGTGESHFCNLAFQNNKLRIWDVVFLSIFLLLVLLFLW